MPRRQNEQKYCSDTDKEYTRIIVIFLATLDVMSPRHCDELGLKLKSLWAVNIHDLLAVLLPPASIARILPVMTNCCDTYHTGKYSEQYMNREPLQVAAPASSMIKVMPLWILTRIAYRFSQFVPKRTSKIRRYRVIVVKERSNFSRNLGVVNNRPHLPDRPT
jgi:hypothetical protein